MAREQVKPVLRTLTWLIRGIASVLIGVTTFGYSAAAATRYARAHDLLGPAGAMYASPRVHG
jgi:hypothetical protein